MREQGFNENECDREYLLREMMKYAGVIFDLDGTLVDSLEDLTAAMNYGLGDLGLEPISLEACRQMVGEGVVKFAERAIGPEHLDKRDRLLELMTTYYYNHCLQNTRPYEGMGEVVQVLLDKGVKLAVLTNKNHLPCVKIVEFLFGGGVFSPIIGMHPGRQRKPDPTSVFEILAAWSLGADEVLFVGDSDVDIQTARAAGVAVAGAAWGYRSVQVLKEAGAGLIIHRPKELLEVLKA